MKRPTAVAALARALVISAIVVPVGLLAAPAASAAPPDPTGTRLSTTTTTVTVNQDGRTFSARLVKPKTGAAHAYPVIAFGHGFVQSTFRYDSTLRSIAGRGYVVIAPNTQTGFFPDHSAFANDLIASAEWASGHVRTADPDHIAFLGHSMGGGAALLAADRDDSTSAVATLAAAETNPSAIAASAGITAPALYVVGSQDGVVSPSTTRKMYDAKPSPAEWVSITGGYHCGFLDSSSFFGLGCDSGSISRSTQLAISDAVVGDWLDRVLKGAAPGTPPGGITVETK